MTITITKDCITSGQSLLFLGTNTFFTLHKQHINTLHIHNHTNTTLTLTFLTGVGSSVTVTAQSLSPTYNIQHNTQNKTKTIIIPSLYDHHHPWRAHHRLTNPKNNTTYNNHSLKHNNTNLINLHIIILIGGFIIYTPNLQQEAQ